MKTRRSSSSSPSSSSSSTVAPSDDDESEDTRCGIGPCRPSWIQRLANKNLYIFLYSFMGFFQSMFFSYSIATITTVEKQFQLTSQTMGILLSGNEVSQVLLSLLLTYFGGSGHRPRLVSLGMVFSGMASLLVVIPHFTYGKYQPVTNDTRNLDLCAPDEPLSTQCQSAGEQNVSAGAFIFLSQFLAGIGTTLFSTLGITYLDDNVTKKSSPMLIGVLSGLRMIGPVLGYALALVFLSHYVNLTEETTLKPSDPAWIGAWWLGFLFIGVLQLGTGWMIACFPRRLPSSSAAVRRQATKVQRTLKEFPAALKRLLTNKAVVYGDFSGVFFVFAFSGYITFLPKYLETQFQQSAAQAGFLNGLVGLGLMVFGFVIAGVVISRYRPRAWVLAVWDIATGFCFVAALVVFAFVGCDSKPIQGIQRVDDTHKIDINTDCSIECQCSANRFAPVCSADGQFNYFSACHTGCHSVASEAGKHIFSNCTCMPSWSSVESLVNGSQVGGDSFTSGYCPSDCYGVFIIYVAVMGGVKFLLASARLGGMLTGFRCVDPEDKSFAIGLGSFFITLFAWIPGPIVYGAIIDRSCLLWRSDCGQKGNCWLYDTTEFRQYLHLTTAAFIFVSNIFAAFLCYSVRNLDLYSDADEPPDAAKRRQTNERPLMIGDHR